MSGWKLKSIVPRNEFNPKRLRARISKVRAWLQGINYNESKIPNYVLPEFFNFGNEQEVSCVEDWFKIYRDRILAIYENEVYGKVSKNIKETSFQIRSIDHNALKNKATRKEISIKFSNGVNVTSTELLIYYPNHISPPFPTFLGLNYFGNHSIHPDPCITLPNQWMPSLVKYGIENHHRATEESRGIKYDSWPIEKILGQGFAVATNYCGDFAPDNPDLYRSRVEGFFDSKNPRERKLNEGGAISMWAWGLIQTMNALENEKEIDPQRIFVVGHSRLGKAALWAAAQDQRFAGVIANNSGCGGAALFRRRFGETIKIINTKFPYWFCENFKKYSGKEDCLPVDQHMLIASIAPRPVYVASATEDLNADPYGEYLSLWHASPIYQRLGKKGIKTDQMPQEKCPIVETLGYHIRPGKHDITGYDWDCFINFIDFHLKDNNL